MSHDDDRGALPDASPEGLERLLSGREAEAWAPGRWNELRVLAVGGMQRHDLPAGTRIRWGRLALAALPGKYREEPSLHSVVEAARVRAYLIREFGPDDTDPARDLAALRADVVRNLSMSLETAARLAGEWQALPREQVLRLRRVKNLLSTLRPVLPLLEDGDSSVEELRAWLELAPRLP
ncbi:MULTISPECIES: hypothetical protein [unclassified Streptomyces]|uniref:hypothetical protein n=1 Tax=unclassified Streptomyces TaxID=2593676 RepID=UPI0006ADAD1D|nr:MULTISPECIES: hypothetical protein [unclassified Streptomyces]KOX23752.1 hypothetical protein ADL06_21670 [Streptomyces sp. NRRL F-6491]KOX40738.1 hypothetical protein ADL08_21155 [Streptomyces sp. NRRL F-6492]